jgi:hypothetical protein
MKLRRYAEVVFCSEPEFVYERSETIISLPHNYDSKACSVVALNISVAVLSFCYNHP